MIALGQPNLTSAVAAGFFISLVVAIIACIVCACVLDGEQTRRRRYNSDLNPIAPALIALAYVAVAGLVFAIGFAVTKVLYAAAWIDYRRQ